MDLVQLKQIIESSLPGARAEVEGDGSHFDAVIVSESFAGLNTVKRQQAVYAALGDLITGGSVHAFSMKTFTLEEWEHKHG